MQEGSRTVDSAPMPRGSRGFEKAPLCIWGEGRGTPAANRRQGCRAMPYHAMSRHAMLCVLCSRRQPAVSKPLGMQGLRRAGRPSCCVCCNACSTRAAHHSWMCNQSLPPPCKQNTHAYAQLAVPLSVANVRNYPLPAACSWDDGSHRFYTTARMCKRCLLLQHLLPQSPGTQRAHMYAQQQFLLPVGTATHPPTSFWAAIHPTNCSCNPPPLPKQRECRTAHSHTHTPAQPRSLGRPNLGLCPGPGRSQAPASPISPGSKML